MKTFVAALAAAAILFAAFLAWQRLDRWEQGKDYWISKYRSVHMPSGPVLPGLSIAEYNAQIAATTAALNDLNEAAREVQLYLTNKPFGLPLSPDERAWLKRVGAQVAENDFTGSVTAIIQKADPKESDSKKEELRRELRDLCARYDKPADKQLAHLESFLQSSYTEVSPTPIPAKRRETPQSTAPSVPSAIPSGVPPDFTIITTPVEVSVAYGKVTLQRGTRVRITSRTANTIHCEYLGTTVSVPVASTDLAK